MDEDCASSTRRFIESPILKVSAESASKCLIFNESGNVEEYENKTTKRSINLIVRNSFCDFFQIQRNAVTPVKRSLRQEKLLVQIRCSNDEHKCNIYCRCDISSMIKGKDISFVLTTHELCKCFEKCKKI